MATRNIVPRATGEGSIGTSAKTWGAVYADDIAVTDSITAAELNGHLKGQMTRTNGGDAIVNTSDSSWIRVNGAMTANNGANLLLYGKDSSAGSGRFVLTATDGVTNRQLIGRNDGTLTWNSIDITPRQHTDNITSSDVSVANNAIKNLMSFSLTKGTWLVHVTAGFPTNATGYRTIGINTNTSSLNMDRLHVVSSPACSGTQTNLSLTALIQVPSTTTYYLNARQTSGSTLAVNAGYQIFRLSAI